MILASSATLSDGDILALCYGLASRGVIASVHHLQRLPTPSGSSQPSPLPRSLVHRRSPSEPFAPAGNSAGLHGGSRGTSGVLWGPPVILFNILSYPGHSSSKAASLSHTFDHTNPRGRA